MTTRTERRLARKHARHYPARLSPVPCNDWPVLPSSSFRVGVWLSRDYLVQAFDEDNDVERLTICSTTVTADGWSDGLSWDELMEIKRQCGYGERVAVEVYPDDDNIVNVANMRHPWLLPSAPEFMWRRS